MGNDGNLPKALEAYDRLLKEIETCSERRKGRNLRLFVAAERRHTTADRQDEGRRMSDARSLNFAERSGHGIMLARAKLGLGVLCASLTRFEEGERLLTEAFLMFSKGEDFDSKQGVGWSLLNLGGLYSKQGKWWEAEQRLDKSIEVLTGSRIG